MCPHAIDFSVTMLGIAIVAAALAVMTDRLFFQQRKYDRWAEANNSKIADLEAKAAALQLKLNYVYGQLLALGIKLPGPGLSQAQDLKEQAQK